MAQLDTPPEDTLLDIVQWVSQYPLPALILSSRTLRHMVDLQMYSCVCAIHKGSWPAQKTIKYIAFNKIMVSIQGADQKTSSLEDLPVSHEWRISGPQETAMSALSDFQLLNALGSSKEPLLSWTQKSQSAFNTLWREVR